MERELHNEAGEMATVIISYPVQTGPESDEYRCMISFRSESEAIDRKAYGLGEMQAMFLGMRSLDGLIRTINSRLSPEKRWIWRGGMNPDDFGLPRADMEY